MSDKNGILLTLSQMAVGVILTVAGSLLYFLIYLLWQVLISDRISHGFVVGFLLIISIGCSYGAIVVSGSEGIRFVGRKFGKDVPFKAVFSGAFLGAPAVVGLLALRNVPWEIFGDQNIILVIILLFKIVAFLLSLPIRAWLLLQFPVEILYILSIPIGAVLGYQLSNLNDTEINVQET